VRTRATVAATVVVAVCLVFAGLALLFVLFRTLESAARAAADARVHQVVDQLAADYPEDLDKSMLATDSQVGVVQVVARDGTLVAQSAGGPAVPLSTRRIDPGTTEFVGRTEPRTGGDFWVTGQGVLTLRGPVTVLVGADRQPVENVVSTVAGLLAVGGPIAIALVAFGTYRLVGVALRPVERIRARVSSMTSTDLTERIPVPPAKDEVARLARTMNAMLDRLESSQRAQRRFVSDASHELRSPLATITAVLDLAQVRPGELDQALIEQALLPETRRMAQLVDDLLLLAHADERSCVSTQVEVDLDDIIYAETERARTVTDLTVQASVSAVRTLGDPLALTRLVRNLVDNAIRHAHSQIRLECRPVGGYAQIVVADDGPGIPVSERLRVFDRFVRLDSPRTRNSGGTGLGLSIVSEIVNAHCGIVRVSESPSGGAGFVVLLPLTVDETVADTADGFDAAAGER
jgi:signal transduction histidine kinase